MGAASPGKSSTRPAYTLQESITHLCSQSVAKSLSILMSPAMPPYAALSRMHCTNTFSAGSNSAPPASSLSRVPTQIMIKLCVATWLHDCLANIQLLTSSIHCKTLSWSWDANAFFVCEQIEKGCASIWCEKADMPFVEHCRYQALHVWMLSGQMTHR